MKFRARPGANVNRRGFGVSEKTGSLTVCELIMIILSYLAVVLTFPISLCCIFQTVDQYERYVIFRNGRIYKNRAHGPGCIHSMMCIDDLSMVDLRIICYRVPTQDVLTKDSLSIAVDAAVFYKVLDPVKALINVQDYRGATQFLAATTLRNAIGARKLTEVLSDRASVTKEVAKQLGRSTAQWGIKIYRVEMKDISLPLDLQRAMAAEAETIRLTNAKIIVTKAEIEAARSLETAALSLSDNPLCMQLRYLQTLHTITGNKTHTIVIPFAVEAYKKIFGR